MAHFLFGLALPHAIALGSADRLAQPRQTAREAPLHLGRFGLSLLHRMRGVEAYQGLVSLSFLTGSGLYRACYSRQTSIQTRIPPGAPFQRNASMPRSRFTISIAASAHSPPFCCMRSAAWSPLSQVSTPLAIGMPVSSCTPVMPLADS